MQFLNILSGILYSLLWRFFLTLDIKIKNVKISVLYWHIAFNIKISLYLSHTKCNLNYLDGTLHENLKLVNSFSKMPYCDIETDTIFLHNSPSNNKIIWMFQRQHLYNSRSVM